MPTETTQFHLPAIHCDGCLNTVRKVVESEGAEYVDGDAAAKTITVRLQTPALTADALGNALEAIGFPPDAQSSSDHGGA